MLPHPNEPQKPLHRSKHKTKTSAIDSQSGWRNCTCVHSTKRWEHSDASGADHLQRIIGTMSSGNAFEPYFEIDHGPQAVHHCRLVKRGGGELDGRGQCAALS